MKFRYLCMSSFKQNQIVLRQNWLKNWNVMVFSSEKGANHFEKREGCLYFLILIDWKAEDFTIVLWFNSSLILLFDFPCQNIFCFSYLNFHLPEEKRPDSVKSLCFYIKESCIMKIYFSGRMFGALVEN